MTPNEPTDPADASDAKPIPVQAYLDEVQARLSDPAVLARATALATERGLDLETMTFGDLDDLINDATGTKAKEST